MWEGCDMGIFGCYIDHANGQCQRKRDEIKHNALEFGVWTRGGLNPLPSNKLFSNLPCPDSSVFEHKSLLKYCTYQGGNWR